MHVYMYVCAHVAEPEWHEKGWSMYAHLYMSGVKIRTHMPVCSHEGEISVQKNILYVNAYESVGRWSSELACACIGELHLTVRCLPYLYIYIYIYIYIYTHTCTCTCIHTYHAYMHTHARAHTHTRTCIHTYHAHVHTYIPCIHAWACRTLRP